MTKPARLLLIDDNRMDVELTLDAFRRSRLANAVSVVTSGEEAIQYLKGEEPFSNRETYPFPHLILLDLKMPGMNGFEVLQQLKTIPGAEKIPVIVLTISKEEGDRTMSLDMGANGYLTKPVSFNQLMDVIRDLGDYWIVLNTRQ